MPCHPRFWRGSEEDQRGGRSQVVEGLVGGAVEDTVTVVKPGCYKRVNECFCSSK